MSRDKLDESLQDPELSQLITDEDGVGESVTGYIRDFISGVQVKTRPEEVGAVQVFARRLVEDFGYPRTHITSRPQYRVRRSPSDSKKSYPVDLAVFASSNKLDSDLLMVVECKSENVKDGQKQLELYLTMSGARLGVWFNGKEHLYLLKEYAPGGQIVFTPLPNIPRYGQRVEDIGRYLRKDLEATDYLEAVLKDIRNYLSGNDTGITKDERLAQQTINLLFCKIYDEVRRGPDELVEFRAGLNEDAASVRKRIAVLFDNVKRRFPDVLDASDTLDLSAESIAYVVGELQPYCITEAKRDVISDAFEVFIGPAIAGKQGQFFTPRNVIQMIVDIVDPDPEEMIIDPACGSGGFLLAALDHVWRKIETNGRKKGWNDHQIRQEQAQIASQYFRGIDKDGFLAKVTKAYMAIVGDGRGGVFCSDSLLPPSKWDVALQRKVDLGTFDVVITNPPFGAKIPVTGKEKLTQYVLGHKAKLNRKTGRYEWQNDLEEKQPPQLIFIERCLQLLKDGGRMGIVIPESILGMPTYTHVVQFLRERVKIVGVVSMPEEVFQPHTHAKVAVIFVKKVNPSPSDEVFMSVVEWCGHDSRGNPTIRKNADGTEELLDDVPKVTQAFREIIKDFK